EPDERADQRTELGRVVQREVALLDDLDLAAHRLLHDEQVDDANRPLVGQTLQLGQDRAVELRAVELEDEHLNGAERRQLVHEPARSFRFCSSNSSSVRMPCAFRSPSCFSCWMTASDIPPAGGAAAGAACCWYCCASS